MPQIDALRGRLLEHGARFTVVKNTLTRRAAEAAGVDALLALLEGPSAIAFIESDGDMVAVAKALADSARETKVLEIRGGIMQGRAISAADVEELAKLPPFDTLRGQVLGGDHRPAHRAARARERAAAEPRRADRRPDRAARRPRGGAGAGGGRAEPAERPGAGGRRGSGAAARPEAESEPEAPAAEPKQPSRRARTAAEPSQAVNPIQAIESDKIRRHDDGGS